MPPPRTPQRWSCRHIDGRRGWVLLLLLLRQLRVATCCDAMARLPPAATPRDRPGTAATTATAAAAANDRRAMTAGSRLTFTTLLPLAETLPPHLPQHGGEAAASPELLAMPPGSAGRKARRSPRMGPFRADLPAVLPSQRVRTASRSVPRSPGDGGNNRGFLGGGSARQANRSVTGADASSGGSRGFTGTSGARGQSPQQQANRSFWSSTTASHSGSKWLSSPEPPGCGLVNGIAELHNGLKHVMDRTGRLTDYLNLPSAFEHDIAAAVEGQLHAELQCLDWVTHAVAAGGQGAYATQARLRAARDLWALRQQLSRLETALCPGGPEEWVESPPQESRSGLTPVSSGLVDNGEQTLTFPEEEPSTTDVLLLQSLPPTPPTLSPQPSTVSVVSNNPTSASDRSLPPSVSNPSEPTFFWHRSSGASQVMLPSEVEVEDEPTRPDIPDVPHEDEEEQTPVVEPNVLVSEPGRRGVSAGQFETFFLDYCGDIIQEGGEASRPVCVPAQIAELCVAANLEAASEGRHGDVRSPNMYAVNDFVIVPHTRERLISYAELLNPEGLQIDFFISHHWGEDIGEFIQSILRHAMAMVGVEGSGGSWQDSAYWCCAFANNQHSVELGNALEESPFYLALCSKGCRGTLMNLNQLGSALCRIWCIYEVYLTHELGKHFVLNSCQGPLTDVTHTAKAKDLWVLHIFRLLQHISVANASATMESDRVKIMEALESFRSSRGTTGAQALDATVKALVAEQAIFTIARRGDASNLVRALDLRADPNAADSNGLRPLTYAIANGHEEAAEVLLRCGADKRAMNGAGKLLELWSDTRATRVQALEEILQLGAESLLFHEEALRHARAFHDTASVAALVQHLDALSPEVRLHAVRELQEHHIYALPYVAKLALCLSDNDGRVRQATVEALGTFGTISLERAGIVWGSIPEDHLDEPLPDSICNVVQLAAQEASGNAFTLLAHGVGWQRIDGGIGGPDDAAAEPPAVFSPSPEGVVLATETGGADGTAGGFSSALQAVDEKRCNVAHLAARAGHVVPLIHLLETKALPRSFVAALDGNSRSALHHAAAAGDADQLVALFKAGDLEVEELRHQDDHGHTPAHLAAAHGHAMCLRALVRECHLPIEALRTEDRSGRNVALLATAGCDVVCLRTLRDLGMSLSDFSRGDKWYYTAAHIAVVKNSLEVVQLLEKMGVAMHLPMVPPGMGPQDVALGSVVLAPRSSAGGGPGPEYQAWRLGKIYYGPDRRMNIRLEYETGQRDHLFMRLDRCHVAPTPLLLAEKLGHAAVEELLKEKWTQAARRLQGSRVEELWNRARQGKLLAGVLASLGAVGAVRDMITSKELCAEDLLKKDSAGCTPLHSAAASGSAATVDAICKLADLRPEHVVVLDVEGRNALHHAAESNDAACVHAVFQLMAKMVGGPERAKQMGDMGDSWHRTPMHRAAAADAADSVQALHALGVRLEPRMCQGSTIGEKGCKVMVHQGPGTSASEQRLGVVTHVFEGGQIRVQYIEGGKEAFVPPERCTHAPTPLQLAEGTGKMLAATVLRQLMGQPAAAQEASLPVSAVRSTRPRMSKRRATRQSTRIDFKRKSSFEGLPPVSH